MSETAPYFDYTVQGVKLTDGRGAWNLQPGTDLLPRFPGLEVTRYNIPGGHGERQVQHAPINPQTYTFVVRFFPLEMRRNHARFGQPGLTWEERVWNLERNVNEFMYHTRLGAMSHLGNVKITREINPSRQQPTSVAKDALSHGWMDRIAYDPAGFNFGRMVAAGRVVSSSDVEFEQDAQYADYTFIFENATGTWASRWRYNSLSNATLRGNRTYGLQTRSGTAPCDDALIAIRPLQTMPPGAWVKNEHGVGFQIRRQLTANRWWVIDTYNWAMGSHSGSAVNWQCVKPDRTSLVEIGRPTGSALNIVPGVETYPRVDNLPRGRIRVRLTAQGKVAAATRQKWF